MGGLLKCGNIASIECIWANVCTIVFVIYCKFSIMKENALEENGKCQKLKLSN